MTARLPRPQTATHTETSEDTVKAMTQFAIPTRRFGAGLAALAASVLACLALEAGAAQAAPCPNEAIREAQTSTKFPEGTVNLPDCMALELVSPAKKFNQYAYRPNFSANGERVEFSSLAALGETPKQASFNDPYIATRGASGWSTESTATPPELVQGSSLIGEPCSFSTDLSRWALWASTLQQAIVGITTPFQGGLGHFFSAVGPTMVPLSGDISLGSFAVTAGRCEGASSDASHLLFSLNAAPGSAAPGYTFLPGDPAPRSFFSTYPANVYEAYLDHGTPTLALLQRDRNGIAYGGSCGVKVGGSLGADSVAQRGSVSPDAGRIYFTTRPDQPEGAPCDETNELRIMRRTETPTGPEIVELVADECTRLAPACSAVDGNDTYLGASQEGDKVFFTTSRQLTDSDRDESKDLYLYEASSPEGERLTQVSAGDNTDPTPGEGSEFLGLADYSGDGTRAYFVAKGVLTTTANQAGKSAEAGKPNLYLYERDSAHPAGRTVFVATLGPVDSAVWSNSPGEKNGAIAVPRLGNDPEDQAVGGDGHILVFGSTEPLNADDTDGGRGDVYLYEAASGAIERVSKAAPGGEDNGAFGVGISGGGYLFPGPQNVSFGRLVSEDAKTIVFGTEEALDPHDLDEAKNDYVWREGAVAALPGPLQQGTSSPTVSMSGNEVAFIDTAQLLPEDGDAAKDVYLVRIGGGFPPPVAPVPCEGEACQGPPAQRPAAQGAASAASTAGNLKEAPCKRGFSRKRGKCVKKQSKKRHRKHSKKANREQGAQR